MNKLSARGISFLDDLRNVYIYYDNSVMEYIICLKMTLKKKYDSPLNKFKF